MEEFQEVPGSTIFIVVAAVISLILSLTAFVLHIIPITSTMFVGTIIEGIFISILIFFSSMIVTFVALASIALVGIEDATQLVQNANLYYFSWAGFILILLLAVEYAKSVYGFDAVNTIRGRSARTDLWAGILVTCIVMLGSCSRTIQMDCNEANYRGKPDGFCLKTRWGIVYGVVGILLTLTILYFKIKGMGLDITIEGGLAIVMCFFSTIMVILLTSASGPGSAVGNLYYFTWGSFLISTYSVFACYGAYSGIDANAEPTPAQTAEASNNQSNGTNHNGDIEVETFDDGKL
jgi:hypothetical protein